MMTIEPPFYSIKGVTIFRDHEDPDLFHCLLPYPRMAKKPQGPSPGTALACTLYKYRRDLTDNPAMEKTRAKGAGLALFETEIPLEKPGALQAELAALTGRPNARLMPVLFRSGSVHAIVAHSEGDRLIEDLVETNTAPIAAPHHAAFILALTAEGASLFQQAASGGQIPVGVVYEMRFLALTPSLHARVSMDFDRAYDRFSASIGFTYYVSVRLDLDLAWLQENGFLKIEIIAFTDAADRERQEKLVMDLVKLRVAQDFFRSGMPPKQPPAGLAGPLGGMLGNLSGGGDITSTSAFFTIKAKYEMQRESKHFEMQFNGRTAVELTHVVSGFLSTLVKDAPAITVKEIDLDDPFFSSLKVTISSAIDFDAMPDLIDAVVQVEFGDHRKAVLFTRESSAPQVFEAALTNPKKDEYRYEVEYHFDHDSGFGPTELRSSKLPSRRRVLVIDPLAHLRYVRVKIRVSRPDFARAPRFQVHLRARDEPEQPDLAKETLRFDQEHPTADFRLRLPMAFSTPRVFARCEWEDAHGDWHDLESETEIRGATFEIPDPFHDVFAIQVQSVADWTKVRQVMVELRYADAQKPPKCFAVFQQGSAATKPVEFTMSDEDHRSYEYRQTVIMLDGQTVERPWTKSDSVFLVVGNLEAPSRSLKLVWLGPPGETLGLRVDLWAVDKNGEEQNESVFLRAGETEKTVTLPFNRDNRLKYRYEVRRFTAAGEELSLSGEDERNVLILR